MGTVPVVPRDSPVRGSRGITRTVPAGVQDYDDDVLLAESDDDIVSVRRSARTGKGGAATPWIIAAALVGIILGVWMAGRPADSPVVPSSAPTTSAPVVVDAETRRAELEALLATSPDDADAHLELGVILYNLGEPDTAKEHWEEVILLNPALAEAWYNLGFYYLGLDPPDYTNAKIVWDKVVEIDPNSELSQTVLNHMGGIFPSDQATG